jgi:hypothetical protein
MSKHEIKLLDNEINDLRNQVFYLNGLLDKITEWLEEEKSGSQEFEGRVESANALLEQIKKWESEDE